MDICSSFIPNQCGTKENEQKNPTEGKSSWNIVRKFKLLQENNYCSKSSSKSNSMNTLLKNFEHHKNMTFAWDHGIIPIQRYIARLRYWYTILLYTTAGAEPEWNCMTWHCRYFIIKKLKIKTENNLMQKKGGKRNNPARIVRFELEELWRIPYVDRTGYCGRCLSHIPDLRGEDVVVGWRHTRFESTSKDKSQNLCWSYSKTKSAFKRNDHKTCLLQLCFFTSLFL